MPSRWMKLAIPASDTTKLIQFDDFFKRGLIMQKSCGSEPYVHNFHRVLWKTILLRLYYTVLVVQMNILVCGEVVIVKQFITDPEYFLAATAMVPCILFCLGMDYKEYLLRAKEKDVYKLMDDLRELFPKSLEDQHRYNAHYFCAEMQKVELLFIVCCLSFTTVFSSMPSVVGLCRIFFTEDGTFGYDLPYTIWYPYDVTKPLPLYIFTYLCQCIAAHTASVLFVGADLLMCGVIAQSCMHFHHIADMIRNYKSKGGIKDIMFLREIGEYHGKILDLCEIVNDTYSVCILLSFATASMAICFIGYNLTSSTISDAIKFGFFLAAEVVQIAAICFYGNHLLDASEAVGDAIYEHDWHNADLAYKKMLIQIIVRSQKQANIRAPTFPPTSYETFMGVMSTSYKFLTVLRQCLNRA